MAERDIDTVTVLGSQAVARADGRVAIVLTTKEKGPIAFEVTAQTIGVLMKDLAFLDAILRQQTGQA